MLAWVLQSRLVVLEFGGRICQAPWLGLSLAKFAAGFIGKVAAAPGNQEVRAVMELSSGARGCVEGIREVT